MRGRSIVTLKRSHVLNVDRSSPLMEAYPTYVIVSFGWTTFGLAYRPDRLGD